MFKLGLRYRKQYKIEGKPDFVFVKRRIAVFVDGDFWHGNNWKIRHMKSLDEEFGKYSKYWKDKINNNIARDKIVTNKLKHENWYVLRFWESDIKKDCSRIAKKIFKAYKKNRKSTS